MDHEIPGTVPEAQRSEFPRAARIVKRESHVPWWFVVVDHSFVGALAPHADHFVNVQTTLER
ncbi:hypothetical protein ACR5KS_12380 [Leucobacter sp. W1153]|uniref:hypothetical protein n=1 Tax=Leucobacter sp. W1153 TaxID=3439064 RepID=UPI003F351EC9